MSKILKEYWSFEENEILTPYKLGQVINIQDEATNLKKSDDDDFDYEYIGSEQFLWIVTIKNERVVRIIYRQKFSIPNFEFWNNNYQLIRTVLSNTHSLVNEETCLKDRMCIITRDDFVSLIILQRSKDFQS
ncbi:MAG: hypothetical protein ABIP27_18420 [Flavobacterium circumlabens]|uniref:hypothetical protein n=1 Tax=Flavobacterium circumlabens TaxID=2133765 RepID=UPI003265348E